ncbi:glycosyltransferase family 4 protein [Breznakibacter xylanolyticus]|nr:glycosyltransferase family 4 protein [Breznakibacter xylanolyticus]
MFLLTNDDDRMHICFLSHEYPLWATGGIGTFIQTLGRALVRHGHRVTVVGIGRSLVRQDFNDQGVSVVRLPMSRIRYAQVIPNVIRIRKFLTSLYRELPIDILESSEAGLAFMSYQTPYHKVIRLHGGHHFFAEAEQRNIHWWKGWQEKVSFKKSDAFIAVSEFVKSHTCKYLSYRQKPITVIPLPLDSTLFRPMPNVEVVAHSLVFAGTVCEKKGVRQLLMALDKVRKRFPDVHLDIYGRDWFDKEGKSYVDRLKKEISSSVLSHVTFHGAIMRHQLPLIFASAELCVFPSHMETLGLVAPEAMLTGRPVLFSETGPGPETIIHGMTGLLCFPLDVSDIANKIIDAFEHPGHLTQIAEQGMIFAREKFDLERITIRNIEFYELLRAGGRQRGSYILEKKRTCDWVVI